MMFGFSESVDIGISFSRKKMETFSGRFWENPGNVFKLELLKMLIDHTNTSVFFQAVSVKSSWSFSYRWTQYQWEKTATKHQFIALLATLVQYIIQIPHIFFCCPNSAYDKWWFEQKKSPHFREKYLVLRKPSDQRQWCSRKQADASVWPTPHDAGKPLRYERGVWEEYPDKVKCLEAKCRTKTPWKYPGSHLRHQIAQPRARISCRISLFKKRCQMVVAN